MDFGGAGLPRAIRQPETARRQKKSGVLELFSYRVSGPFPALFYSLSDRVPTDPPAMPPIPTPFRPTCSRIRTPSGDILPATDPASRRSDFRGADSGTPDRIGFLTRPRLSVVDHGMPDPPIARPRLPRRCLIRSIPRST